MTSLKVRYKCMCICWLFLITSMSALAQNDARILEVGKDKPFTTIQSAIDASQIDRESIIVVAPGTYREKLFITRNNLAIVGASAENTIVEYPILRSKWRETHPSDWGAAVVNIDAINVTLVNLSVINPYGRQHNTDEHQFAVRGFTNSDKVIFDNCRMIADGADTVSLWNKHGRYYHSNCYFEGHTDMVCPRGTALIENSTFFNGKQSATLWHDGELGQNYKLVVNNSEFDGVDGYWLGRHHYDAQFYLLNSTFSERMADKPIFKKRYNNKNIERANLYGARYFFENNKFQPSLNWMQDNFSISNIIPQKHDSLQSWVFDGSWHPKLELAELAGQLSSYIDSGSMRNFGPQK